jgi:hypothetical protein
LYDFNFGEWFIFENNITGLLCQDGDRAFILLWLKLQEARIGHAMNKMLFRKFRIMKQSWSTLLNQWGKIYCGKKLNYNVSKRNDVSWPKGMDQNLYCHITYINIWLKLQEARIGHEMNKMLFLLTRRKFCGGIFYRKY